MAIKNPGPYEYVLTKPIAGKSGEYGGIKFFNGRALISGMAHDSIGHLLHSDYAAKLASECTEEELRASPGVGNHASPTVSASQVNDLVQDAVRELSERLALAELRAKQAEAAAGAKRAEVPVTEPAAVGEGEQKAVDEVEIPTQPRSRRGR